MPDIPDLEPIESMTQRLYSTNGIPFHWTVFDSEDLKNAIADFTQPEPITDQQLALVVDYFRYWFTAPYWRTLVPKVFINRPMRTQGQALTWLSEAKNRWAIDPL